MSSTKATTHVLMIVDMSGSMSPVADDVRGGFNSYIAGLTKTDTVRYRITATVFDTQFICLCVDAKRREVPELTEANYEPRGMTALLDAVGKTIAEFDARVPQLGDSDRVLVVVQTDGYENNSQEFTWDMISELIKEREATGKWSFIYLGAGMDTWAQASKMGFSRDGYITTSKSSVGTQATYSGLVNATRSFSAGASKAETLTVVADTPGVAQ